MTEIYKDKSYFDTVRNSSYIDIALINNIVPAGVSLYGTYYHGVPAAEYSGFAEYDEKINISTSPTPITDRVIAVPLRSFSYPAKTPPSDSTGALGTSPTITIKGAFSAGTKVTLLLGREETSFTGIAGLYVSFFSDASDAVPAVDDYVNTPDYSEFVSFTVPVQCCKVTIEIMEVYPPSSSVTVRSVLFGDYTRISAEDINELTVNSKRDITGAALPSAQLTLKLSDSEGKYSSFTHNTVCLRCWYKGDGGKEYSSEGTAYFTAAPPDLDLSQEIPKVTINAVDALSIISNNCPATLDEGADRTVDAVHEVLYKARLNYKESLVLGFNDFLPPVKPSDIKWDINILYGVPYNTAVQKYGMFDGLLFSKSDSILLGDAVISDNKAPVLLSEQYSKPVPKVYPKLRNLEIELEKLWRGDKETIVDNAEITLDAGVNTAIVNFQSEYVIQDITDAVSQSDSDVVITCGSSVYTSYDTQGGDRYFTYSAYGTYMEITLLDEIDSPFNITVKGYKVIKNKASTKKQINAQGEDLTVFTNAFGVYKGTAAFVSGLPATDANIPDSVMNAFAKPYEYTQSYELNMRGRFDLDAGDCIYVETTPDILKKCVVTAHKLTYNGAFSSTVTVFETGNEIYRLTPKNTLYPDNSLKPKE